MKLSEAILLGSTVAEPLDNSSWEKCLCGVACAAFGRTNVLNKEAEARWPWLRERKFKPFNRDGSIGDDSFYLGKLVVTRLCGYVVDGAMTLERAVDLIRQIEPQDAPPQQSVQEQTHEEETVGAK